jgi:hypothetical protein
MAVKKLDHYRSKLEAAMKELDEAAQAEAIVVEEYEVRTMNTHRNRNSLFN